MSDQFDINALLNQAMEMQNQLMEAQAEAAEAEVVGRAGGGAVEITVTGSMQFLDVAISAEAVDPDDVATLEDAVLAALHDAMAQIDAMQRSSLGGLDLGALGGLSGMAPGEGVPGGLPGFGGALDVPSTAADGTREQDDDEPRP
ncbi:MAG TPA: YbaB/EbfC family nucleoid-associated protein [Acidimicrobiales bacterium]